jgi:hypothetical protein
MLPVGGRRISDSVKLALPRFGESWTAGAYAPARGHEARLTGGLLLSGDLLLDPGSTAGLHHEYDHPVQDLLAKHVQLGSAIIGTLEELHPADPAFALARAPGHGQRGFDGLVTLVKTPGNQLERWNVPGLGLPEPLLERHRILLGQQNLKAGVELIPTGQHEIGLQEAL